MELVSQPLNNQELFPIDWLLTDEVQAIIRVSPLGICLLQAIPPSPSNAAGKRNNKDVINDFCYLAVNDVLQAMLNLPIEDIIHRTMRFLSHDANITDVIGRLAQTVYTGEPDQHIETYQLDGVISTYHQIYVASGDGILLLVQDVTYTPLSDLEEAANKRLLVAVRNKVSVTHARTLLLGLISGQIS
jgi:hypothetical protein